MPRYDLREWQKSAMVAWEENHHRGIISVVTGGGKTFFALACIKHLQPDTALVVVPTVALLDQWWEEVADFFDLDVDEVHVITGKKGMRSGTVNLAVLNTASQLSATDRSLRCFLIVDECHKAASEHYKAVLTIPTVATLGLSATPERPYDNGLTEVLMPALGPIIYTYSYRQALADLVIVPFTLNNIVFELEPERQAEYDRLTRAIARSIARFGVESPETVALFLKRARVMNMSLNRVRLALKLVALNQGRQIVVFHEDIEACQLITQVLIENGIRAGAYHSRLTARERVRTLASYRRREIQVLVTCRALDEGFNVPETEVGIIAASTATRRQRIQRLGRVLRPASGKSTAEVYTLVATEPEVARLRAEEDDLDGVAESTWSRA